MHKSRRSDPLDRPYMKSSPDHIACLKIQKNALSWYRSRFVLTAGLPGRALFEWPAGNPKPDIKRCAFNARTSMSLEQKGWVLPLLGSGLHIVRQARTNHFNPHIPYPASGGLGEVQFQATPSWLPLEAPAGQSITTHPLSVPGTHHPPPTCPRLCENETSQAR